MPKNPTHVLVRHSDGREWNCPIRALSHYREAGWTPVNEQKQETPKTGGSSNTRTTTTAGD